MPHHASLQPNGRVCQLRMLMMMNPHMLVVSLKLMGTISWNWLKMSTLVMVAVEANIPGVNQLGRAVMPVAAKVGRITQML
jgi:hypothetical protein